MLPHKKDKVRNQNQVEPIFAKSQNLSLRACLNQYSHREFLGANRPVHIVVVNQVKGSAIYQTLHS